MKQQTPKADEWRLFYNYGTFIEPIYLKKKQPFNEIYSFVVIDQVKHRCPAPFANAQFMVAIIDEKNQRVAQADIRLFWCTNKTNYTAQEFILGFDDIDTDTHTASIALLRNVLPANGLKDGAAVYIEGLDTAPNQENREQLFDLLLDAIKLASCAITKGIEPRYWLMHFCQGMYPQKQECMQIGRWFKNNPFWIANFSKLACVFSSMKHEFLSSYRIYSDDFLPEI